MARVKVIAKSGMEGRTTRTERWGRRAEYKSAARKQRRHDDKQTIKEER